GIVIGDKTSWGKGYGGDAIVTCLSFAFLTLGLHSVCIKADERHAKALELYRRLGFVQTGVERECAYRDGCFAGHVVFDMLEDEYRALYRVKSP
ncbi:MAG: GNAT family N-acetyltransferase, partial [Thermoleophilia bacterium]|nr:GNAT family N-acetyltransferase [Thermoleophilia bacterium]